MWSPTVTPLVGPYFTSFLPKSVKNGAKRGYPLFFTHFGELSASRGTPPTPNGLSDGIFEHLLAFPMLENITVGHFLEVGGGYPLGAKFKKYPLGEGGHT